MMVMSANGRADVTGSPIQLGDFLPERREVEINGQRYRAWVVTNRRFPRSVQAELDVARNRYMRAVAPLLQPNTPEDIQDSAAQAARVLALEQADVAFTRYVTDALVALVQGLSESEADLIDAESASRLLTELGYFQPLQPAAERQGAADAADPLTGASSLADSPTGTPAADPASS